MREIAHTNLVSLIMRKGLRGSLKSAARRIFPKRQQPILEPGDEFLTKIRGVIHVGANTGQEAGIYFQLGLNVVWVEPNPDVFTRLESNIEGLRGQRAFQYLLSDVDDAIVPFNVADNDGLSSSMLELKGHRDIWPQVGFEKTIELPTCTLDTMLRRERIRATNMDALVLDTQGSELMVLRGATSYLKRTRFIKVEVPDFEAYEGCCQLSDVAEFMAAHGFEECRRSLFAERAEGGRYYDIVYSRQKRWTSVLGTA